MPERKKTDLDIPVFKINQSHSKLFSQYEKLRNSLGLNPDEFPSDGSVILSGDGVERAFEEAERYALTEETVALFDAKTQQLAHQELHKFLQLIAEGVEDRRVGESLASCLPRVEKLDEWEVAQLRQFLDQAEEVAKYLRHVIPSILRLKAEINRKRQQYEAMQTQPGARRLAVKYLENYLHLPNVERFELIFNKQFGPNIDIFFESVRVGTELWERLCSPPAINYVSSPDSSQ
jgi:hypothetical protein